MSPQEHLEWCEEMIRLGLVRYGDDQRRLEKHIVAEFVL